MALVPHKITALAESDAQGTDGKNIVEGAVVSLYDTDGNAVALFDDENGSNGSTAKQTDATGQVVVYVEQGEYDEEVNGSVRRRVLIGSAKGTITSYATTAELEATRPNKTGQRAENRERANAQYTLAAEGYTALPGDVVAANGRVWALQVNVKVPLEWFGAKNDGVTDDYAVISGAVSRGVALTPLEGSGYALSETLIIPSGSNFVGNGYFRGIKFIGLDKTKSILKVQGEQEFGNFSCIYPMQVTTSDTQAIAIEFDGLLNSVVHPIYTLNNYYGLHMPQEDGFGAFGNTLFQNTFIHIECKKSFGKHIDFRTFNNASTGNTFLNIRTSNFNDAVSLVSTSTSIDFGTFTENSFGQINIEGGEYSGSALRFSGNNGHQSLQSLHFEGIAATGNLQGLIEISGGSAAIGALDVRGLNIAEGISYFLFKTFSGTVDGVRVKVEGMTEESEVEAGSSFKVLVDTSTQQNKTQVEIPQARVENLIGQTSSNSTRRYLKSFGTKTPSYSTYVGDDIQIVGDENLVADYFSTDRNIIFDSELTQNRTVSFDNSEMPKGESFKIFRRRGGAGTLLVSIGGRSFFLTEGEGGQIVFDGFNWNRVI